ncbi:hypothetical protein AAAC13_00835 [Pseudomonas aeruginosa]|uniref:hypothetical protein n=1 Tax=Pseudomonas aeruginosa group TaxID=136841 RepID=UPI000666DE76|nr:MULTISPECIES: hypothetical protein [Pseudomonas aeruginosa group]EIU1446652.1 hypothetical protein [Pseudomonas aeruginosa]EJH4818660.1 hypothetical protein [Pseudomonas aeruginosa]EKS3059394.1 hypothetical protein [Pseudomonas aeruginosa]EKU4839018.1 hypothetical protein [Pseudomonas aeruginosa]EKU5976083.1 hypothetical protein [Pseudomonas aeruginosa]
MQIEMNALTNPLEMTLAYDSGGEGRNSRNAPKFIVHFPLNLYEALIRLSVLEERSLNGEVVAGLISGLTGHAKLELDRKLYADALGEESVQWLLQGHQPIDPVRGKNKFVVRLKWGMPEVLTVLAAQRKSEDPAFSMHQLYLEYLCRWVNLRRETHLLATALLSDVDKVR